jgi:hypothetical protein
MKIRTPYSPLALFAWQRDDAFETDHLKSLDCRGAKIASHSKKSR